MTRWDCDVKLWRGVPCSFPFFYGWPVSRFLCDDDIVLSSTATLRYICCRVCYKWVPESSPYHVCTTIPVPRRQESKIAISSDFNSIPEEEEDTTVDEKCVYVVSTEENSESHLCGVCTDRMHLEFLHEIEEWAFMDCVEHEGFPMHKLCRDCVYGDENA